MHKHPTGMTRGRSIGLVALAVLVALVAAVSSSSADSTTSSAAPAVQAVENMPVQQTTPSDPPAGSDRPGKEDCPEGGRGSGGGEQDESSGPAAPDTTTPALEL